MKASATAYGLDEFIYPSSGNQLTLVDQTGCQYNNTKILPPYESDFDYEEHMNAMKSAQYVEIEFLN
jgi:hypothetical protein